MLMNVQYFMDFCAKILAILPRNSKKIVHLWKARVCLYILLSFKQPKTMNYAKDSFIPKHKKLFFQSFFALTKFSKLLTCSWPSQSILFGKSWNRWQHQKNDPNFSSPRSIPIKCISFIHTLRENWKFDLLKSITEVDLQECDWNGIAHLVLFQFLAQHLKIQRKIVR